MKYSRLKYTSIIFAVSFFVCTSVGVEKLVLYFLCAYWIFYVGFGRIFSLLAIGNWNYPVVYHAPVSEP